MCGSAFNAKGYAVKPSPLVEQAASGPRCEKQAEHGFRRSILRLLLLKMVMMVMMEVLLLMMVVVAVLVVLLKIVSW